MIYQCERLGDGAYGRVLYRINHAERAVATSLLTEPLDEQRRPLVRVHCLGCSGKQTFIVHNAEDCLRF